MFVSGTVIDEPDRSLHTQLPRTSRGTNRQREILSLLPGTPGPVRTIAIRVIAHEGDKRQHKFRHR